MQVSNSVARLKATSAILDGESLAMKGGLFDFHDLRHHLGEAVPAIVYQVFDLSLEGMVSTRVDSPYRSGRTDDWVKETLTVIGFGPDGHGRVVCT